MTNIQEGGNVPREKTIDAGGNIIDKPYGLTRWARVRKYDCEHGGCDKAAVKVEATKPIHNCCTEHEERPFE